MNEWIYFVVCIDVQDSHTLWTMEFMARPCNKINIYFGQVDGKMSNSLNSICMKNCIVLLGQFSNSLDVGHIANFIVGMHQGDQCFL